MDVDEFRSRFWPYLLHVDIVEARDVAVQDFLTSDPFAVVTIGSQSLGRTKVVMRNLNPVWNEQMSTPLLHRSATLRVSLYDFDYASTDDDLGYVEVNLASLVVDDTENFALPIMRDANKLSKGFLHLNICISTRAMPAGIRHMDTPLSALQLPTGWCCEVVRHIKKYYQLEGTKFTGLHPNVSSALMCPEVGTRELISDINSLLYGVNAPRGGAAFPVFIGKPIAKASLKLSCRRLFLRTAQEDHYPDSELHGTQWILPYLPTEASVMRLETASGSVILLNTPNRHGSWAILRLLRCLHALNGYEDSKKSSACENIPFVWAQADIKSLLSTGDLISSAYHLWIGEVVRGVTAPATGGHRRRDSEIPQHVTNLLGGRLSHLTVKNKDGIWKSTIKLEYDDKKVSGREDKVLEVADIIDIRYKSDARGAVAEIRLSLREADLFNAVEGRSLGSSVPKLLIGGMSVLKSSYYIAIKPPASACSIIEIMEVSDKTNRYSPSIDELPIRVGIVDEDHASVFDSPATSAVTADLQPALQRQPLKRSHFVRSLDDPLSDIIEHISSGVDVFLIKGHLYSSHTERDNDSIKNDRFDLQPEILCHAFVPYSRILSDSLSDVDIKGTNRSQDGIKNTRPCVHLQDLPEYHITPLRLDRNGQHSALLPLGALHLKCRFCTINGKMKKTKHGGYYPYGEYADGNTSKKTLPWGRVICLRAKDGLFWADLIRIEFFSDSEAPFAFAYIPLEDFRSQINRTLSLSLISPAETLKDAWSDFAAVGGVAENDALGQITVLINRVTSMSDTTMTVSLSCDIVPHDPGYQTGWHTECMLAGSTESVNCAMETFSLSPGPEGLYLAAYPDDKSWWQDYNKKGASKQKDVKTGDDLDARVTARKMFEERVLLTAEERKDMSSPHVMVPWEAVLSAVTLSPNLLAVQVCVHRLFLSSKSSKLAAGMRSFEGTSSSYHEALVDLFIIGCPAEELRYLIAERFHLRQVRSTVVDAVRQLKQIGSESASSEPSMTLSTLFDHTIAEAATDMCEPAVAALTKELIRCIKLPGHLGLTSGAAADYVNGKLALKSGVNYNRQVEIDTEPELSRSILRQIMRVRLYFAVLTEKLEISPNLLIINEETRNCSLEMTALRTLPDLAESVLMRLCNRLNISKIAAAEALKATRIVLEAGDLESDLQTLADANDDVQITSPRIRAVSASLKKKLHMLLICSAVLMRTMLSVNPSFWETALIVIVRRFIESYMIELINCLKNNFTAMGWLLSKEELVVRQRRAQSGDGIVPTSNLLSNQLSISEDNDDDNTTGVGNKKLVAVQLYQLLSVFAANNSLFDQSIRDALIPFALELGPTFSLHLSDFLDVDDIVVKWSSVLVIEMRAWVDSVIQQQKIKPNEPAAQIGSTLSSSLPWLPKQFEDGVIISFIPESATSALYNYLEECKFETNAMSESFLAYGDKLECVVKNAFAVSYIYLSSCYKNELRKCCKSWGLIDNRPKRQTHIEPVRDFVKARRLSAQRIGEDNGSDDDKLAWLCSVGNDSFRAIVENLNGDVVGKYFELSEESIIETRVGFSESHVESSFDRACLSFKDNLLLSAEAIVCLILRDTQAFDGDIVSAWINVPGSNGVFQLTVNALRFHFHNLKNFLKEYVYGIFVVILCQKMTTLYGQFIRYLHAHVVSSDLVRSKFTSVSIAQIRDDLDNLIATFDYGISLVFPSHVVSEECIRHRARVSIEISRLQQLKTFFSYSPSSAEVMQVVHELVKEAQIKKSFAINLSNMVEACLSLCVNATAGDKHAAKESERKAAEKTLTKPEKRKSLFTFFGAGGEDPEESVSAAINQSRKHISGFVAVEMLRRLQDVDTTLNDSSSVSQETFSDVSIWGEYVTTLMTTSYDIATISFMAHENKPLILRETIIDIDNKIVPVKPGKAKLLLQHVRALQLPNLGLHFRKAPLQLHCRLGNDEVTTNAVRGGRTCEWEEAIEFEISDLSALSRRQLYIDIFFRGTLWGNVSVGQCVFFLVGLSSTDLTVKSEVNFHHSADSVKEVLQRNNDGDLVTKTYVEATMKIVILASS